MRPVNKPLPPRESPAYGGFNRGWSPNRTLQGALVDTIGDYCSFCELPINVDDNIEDKRGAGRGMLASLQDWDYLLLGCAHCQTYRRPGTIAVSDYLWPDVDATFTLDGRSPFVYTYKDVRYVLPGDSGTTKLVVVEADTRSSSYGKAQKLLDLYQLNTPDYDARTGTLIFRADTLATYPDRRLFLRTDAWRLAQDVADKIVEAEAFTLSDAPLQVMLHNASVLAETYGFWSVWMTVFWQRFGDRQMLEKLFVATDDMQGRVIRGYQGLTSPPYAPVEQGRPKRRRLAQIYQILPGTAGDKITYSDGPPPGPPTG